MCSFVAFWTWLLTWPSPNYRVCLHKNIMAQSTMKLSLCSRLIQLVTFVMYKADKQHKSTMKFFSFKPCLMDQFKRKSCAGIRKIMWPITLIYAVNILTCAMIVLQYHVTSGFENSKLTTTYSDMLNKSVCLDPVSFASNIWINILMNVTFHL